MVPPEKLLKLKIKVFFQLPTYSVGTLKKKTQCKINTPTSFYSESKMIICVVFNIILYINIQLRVFKAQLITASYINYEVANFKTEGAISTQAL